jgi:hypothetical protein
MSLNDKIQSILKSFSIDKEDFNSGLIDFDDLKNKYLSRRGLLSELYPLLNSISESENLHMDKRLILLKMNC